jgi:hypothetical protein
MLPTGWLHGNSGIADQAAWREAYFVNRHKILEELLPTDVGCHAQKMRCPRRPNPSAKWGHCLFINE